MDKMLTIIAVMGQLDAYVKVFLVSCQMAQEDSEPWSDLTVVTQRQYRDIFSWRFSMMQNS